MNPRSRHRAAFLLFLLAPLGFLALPAQEAKLDLSNNKPNTPAEELKTFKIVDGFTVQLAACEPQVVDPVAMAFDERGRLFVAEMRGYPNAGVGTGKIDSGRIRLLEDRDGDGFFETSTVYAEGLRFPTGLMPYKNGLLVANAPDLIYLQDTDDDGKADKQRVLYTGFDVANIQQLLNSFQWGYDNWIHACAGGAGGQIKSAEKPDWPALTLRGRGIRFKPDEPGSLQPTSGGGQYGLTCDDIGHWFTNTNSQHIRQIVLPNHYLARNPLLPVAATTIDIPEHGAACKVFRISPFEAWRVERTRRRKGGPDSKRFPTTELVPGGYSTSTCSPIVYRGEGFPDGYYGSVFMCDPANNVLIRDVLAPNGPGTLVARRGHADCEFLASTDNWFRPTYIAHGPDGCLYVSDFYREVIETPLSLPDDIKKAVNLESRERGRIWRIAPVGHRPERLPDLSKASPATLVHALERANIWHRLTAQRLLVERQDKKAMSTLELVAAKGETPHGRIHAMWALEGMNGLQEKHIVRSLKDTSRVVRVHGLHLAEARLQESPLLRKAVADMAQDSSPEVRFQLAFTLGEAQAPELLDAWAALAATNGDDPWMQIALLSSVSKTAPALLQRCSASYGFTRYESGHRLEILKKLAQLAVSTGRDEDLARVLEPLKVIPKKGPAPWQVAVLEGIGQGLIAGNRSLEQLWSKPPKNMEAALGEVRPVFADAARYALGATNPVAERLAAIRLVGLGPFETAEKALPDLLAPQQPLALQLEAVKAMSPRQHARVGPLLVAAWQGAGPQLRREILEALLARKERVQTLLDGIEAKTIVPGQLEPGRVAQLRKYPDAAVQKRALKLLAGLGTPDRLKVVKQYESVLDTKGEVERGRAVFRKHCATCHRLENHGVEVGADLQAALPNKTPEQLLTDILDPSREVDPRFLEYLATTKGGRFLTGVIAAETATSITLRRAEKAEDTLLRSQLESIQATGKSLMPEGLEKNVPPAEMADLIAYLLEVRGRK